MSQENIAALKKALAASRERPEDFLALLDEDVVWDPGDWPGGKARGHDGVRQFFRQWLGAFEDFRFEPVEYRDGGHAVFVHMRQWGRGRGSGAPTQIDLWQVWLFFDGKVVRFVQKPDRAGALRAAGLAEEAVFEENSAVVRRIYDAVAENDAAGVLALYDPRVEFDFTRSPLGDFLTRSPYRGQAGIREWITDRYEAWETIEDSCDELIPVGDQVVSVVRTRGRGRKSGAEVEMHHAGLWTLREGKVTRVDWFGSREEALEAAGIAG